MKCCRKKTSYIAVSKPVTLSGQAASLYEKNNNQNEWTMGENEDNNFWFKKWSYEANLFYVIYYMKI